MRELINSHTKKEDGKRGKKRIRGGSWIKKNDKKIEKKKMKKRMEKTVEKIK